MWHILDYNDLTNLEKNKFLKFCKIEALNSNDSAAENMWSNNWKNNNNTLIYILSNTDRFNGLNGSFYILKYDDQIVGCSGVYISDFSKHVSIAGCRTWINKNHRNKSLVRDFLLPIQKKWTLNKKIKIIALTFNEYNKNLVSLWKRNRLGKKRADKKLDHIFYNNFNEIKFPLNIQFTPQWIIYEKLDENFNFDWSTIAWSKK